VTEGVSVIIPTYNEAENLGALFVRLRRALPEAELLVVDDRSADETAAVAASLGARVIRRTGPRDLASSVVDGLRAARHDLCACLDADLSHPPEVLPSLVAAVRSGSAMALGSRYTAGGHIRGWPLRRRITSRAATWLTWPLTDVADPMSGCFVVRRSAVDLDKLRPRGFKIALEIIVRGHIRPVELPLEFTDRAAGDSKLDWRATVQFARQVGALLHHRWVAG
jgi:dolichol-phosphate mannosyltransferase